MKTFFRLCFRLARGALFLLGLLALLFAAAQFTNLPWRAYRSLSGIPAPCPHPPSHLLVMGGSGIPGESGLMRTFYAAQAAARHPDATVLVAMPLDAASSDASRAYLEELRLRGVPPERIRILPGGRNTREQALRLCETLAGQTNPPHVLLVSDPAHIRRTAACIRKACRENGSPLHLAALPAHALSIEDPLPGRAADRDASPAAAVPAVPAGASRRFRYDLWNNLGYSQDALREYAALLYYRLRGWI